MNNSNNFKTSPKKTRALVIFSGGLDSLLAARILQKQGLTVTGLTFESYFFDATQARLSAQLIDLPLITQDFSPEHLEIVKNPRHGRGKTYNPCIDCHKLMLLEAWKIKQAQDFDILASGEVLGQRPLSQTKKALDLINRQLKKVDPEIEVLRPLSAQRLVKTYYEQAGLVQREQLGSIEGRNRKQQLALAQELGLAEFPTPSGGCLLTVPEFGQKLKLLLECNTHPHPSDFELLKIGRHFWLSQKDADRDTELDLEKLIRPSSSKEIVAHLILGRNKEENQQIWQLQQPGDFLVEREDLKGPTALLRFSRKDHQRRERVCNPVPRKEIDNQAGLQDRSSYDAYPEPFLAKTQELIFRFSKSSLTDWRDLPCKTIRI